MYVPLVFIEVYSQIQQYEIDYSTNILNELTAVKCKYKIELLVVLAVC